MRTTIRIDDALLAEAKEIAAKSGKPLAAVIEDAVRESFARRRQQKPSPPIELPTWDGGVLPGIDLDKTSALLDPWEKYEA